MFTKYMDTTPFDMLFSLNQTPVKVLRKRLFGGTYLEEHIPQTWKGQMVLVIFYGEQLVQEHWRCSIDSEFL